MDAPEAIEAAKAALFSPFGIATAVVIALFFLRRAALPKPFPGIPYNQESANRLLGDLPLILSSPAPRQWFPDQAVKHNSPIIQVFLAPFQRPWILVADQYEGASILTRRLKEFDRAKSTGDQFHGVVPSGIITLQSGDKKYKRSKELLRDLMSPGFLDNVSAPHIYGTARRLVQLWERKIEISQGRPFEISADIHNATCDMITMAAFGVDVNKTQLVAQLSQLAPANNPSLRTSPDSEEAFEFDPVPLGEDMNAVSLVSDSILIPLKYPFPRLAHFLYRNLNSKMRHAGSVAARFVTREIGNSVARLERDEPEWCALDQMLARERTIASKEGRKPDYFAQNIKSEVSLTSGHSYLPKIHLCLLHVRTRVESSSFTDAFNRCWAISLPVMIPLLLRRGGESNFSSTRRTSKRSYGPRCTRHFRKPWLRSACPQYRKSRLRMYRTWMPL